MTSQARNDADPLEEPPEQAGDGLRDRISARTEESIGDLARALLDTPGIGQALQAVFGARDLATNASHQAMRSLDVAAAADLDRLARRLRSLSDRLETLEDSVDRLSREIAELQGGHASSARGAPVSQERLGEERLGLTE